MSLPDDYLEYPWRRHGMDHDRYTWAHGFERPRVEWPGGKRVALWVVPALEFFPLNPTGQPFKAPGSMVTPYPDFRHYTTRDYGNRVGIYRLLKVFDSLGIPASVAVNAAVAERYPVLLEDVVARGHEVIAHGYDMDSLHHSGLSADDERALVRRTLEALRRLSGQPVTGWLSPAQHESFATPDLVAEQGIEYVCDWINDDLPYRMNVADGTLWAMPHNTQFSDRKILIDYHQSEDAYVEQLRDAFDRLYREAEEHGGRILCLPLTPYITGLPFRIRALAGLLEHIVGHDGVWPATGAQILEAWRKAAA